MSVLQRADCLEVPSRNVRQFSVLWKLTWAVPAAFQLMVSVVFAEFGVVGSPVLLFWLVLIATSGCVVSSAAVIVRAERRDEPELGYLGLFFFAVSVLPLVHGFMTPGVFFSENSAATSAAQWSIPAALLVGAPLLLPLRFRTKLPHRLWRPWATVSIVAVLGLAGCLIVWTELLPALVPGSWYAYILAAVSLAGCVSLSRRHLYLAQVANSRMPLVMSCAFGLVGSSALVWFGAAPFSLGFWAAHGLDALGVFGGSAGALVVLRSTSRVRLTIEPILAVEPLAALELGLDPVIHRFVNDLESKDSVTRDHVIRTAEIAVRVGQEMGLSGHELRQLGLAALLHDIGKLEVPDEILNKPDRLTDDEYQIMKGHAALGQALVETSPALAQIGRFIRSHHERVDGNGYPDRLAGDAIPLISRIVAACDAFDAMAYSRQYRAGMGRDRALAVLREHVGSQWDVAVVKVVVAVAGRGPIESAKPALDAVGRDGASALLDSAPCEDCIPAQLRTLTG